MQVEAHTIADPYPPNPNRLPMILLLLLLVHISGYPMHQICERLLLNLLLFCVAPSPEHLTHINSCTQSPSRRNLFNLKEYVDDILCK